MQFHEEKNKLTKEFLLYFIEYELIHHLLVRSRYSIAQYNTRSRFSIIEAITLCTQCTVQHKDK